MPNQKLHPVAWTKAKGFHFDTKKGAYVRRYEAENLYHECVALEEAYQELQQSYYRLRTNLRGLANELKALED